eukprot:766625-Prymnesium_polylepis.1
MPCWRPEAIGPHAHARARMCSFGGRQAWRFTFEVSVSDADAVQVADAIDKLNKARLQLWTTTARSQLAKVAKLQHI